MKQEGDISHGSSDSVRMLGQTKGDSNKSSRVSLMTIEPRFMQAKLSSLIDSTDFAK